MAAVNERDNGSTAEDATQGACCPHPKGAHLDATSRLPATCSACFIDLKYPPPTWIHAYRPSGVCLHMAEFIAFYAKSPIILMTATASNEPILAGCATCASNGPCACRFYDEADVCAGTCTACQKVGCGNDAAVAKCRVTATAQMIEKGTP